MRFFFLVLLLFGSCNSTKKDSQSNMLETNSESALILVEDVVDNTISNLYTEQKHLEITASDTAQIEEKSWEERLLEVKSEISLFSLGSFGEIEEMPSAYRDKSWMGLYLSDSLASLTPVSLKFEVEEMQDCGDDVYVSLAEEGPTPYFLISGLDSIASGVPYAKSEIYKPIDISSLRHPEITYFFDWGETQKVNEYVSEHVRVHWTAYRESPTDTLTQTLFEAYKVPLDNNLNINFMGDLDGDSIYDLIVDISTGYSYSVNVLYLSSHAGPDEILKPVAVFRTWAC